MNINIVVKAVSVTRNTVGVDWRASQIPAPIRSITVQYRTIQRGNTPAGQWTNFTQTRYLTGFNRGFGKLTAFLTAGTLGVYEIKALLVTERGRDNISYTVESNITRFSLGYDPRPPSPTVQEITNNQLRLSWIQPLRSLSERVETYVVQYRIDRGLWLNLPYTGPTGNNLAQGSTQRNNMLIPISSLDFSNFVSNSNVSYIMFRMRSIDEWGRSSYAENSNALRVVNINNRPPPATYSLTRSASSVNEGQSVTFTMTTTNVANGTVIPYGITGVSTADIGGAPLNGNFTINNSTANLTLNITLDGITEGTETLTITAADQTISVIINDTAPPPPPPPPPPNQRPGLNLFDRSSWANQSGLLPTYLNMAADRWARYVKFNDNVHRAITNIIPGWNGMRLNSLNLVNAPTEGWAAACGPRRFADLDARGDTKVNTIDFDLWVNTAFYSNTGNIIPKWVDVFVHELAHALGIGVYWNLASFLGSPVQWYHQENHMLVGERRPEANNSVSRTHPGSVFINTQRAYDARFNFQNLIRGRQYIPIAWRGGGEDGHWSHERNPRSPFTFYHPPVEEDIVSYFRFYEIEKYITLISIKHLVDLGYEEVNPGTAEIILVRPRPAALNDDSNRNLEIKCPLESLPINPNTNISIKNQGKVIAIKESV